MMRGRTAAVPAPRPCATRAAPMPRAPLPQPAQLSLSISSLRSSSSPFAIAFRSFATDVKSTVAPAQPPVKVDPRAFGDVSPITGNKKPPGKWRELWFGGEDTMWISEPIAVTKHMKRNPYQWARHLEAQRIKERDRTRTLPNKILISNHAVQLITTGKPLNDRRKLTFKIPIKMSKVTLRQYLSKLYSLDVAKVNTMNVEGKWKRRTDGRGRYQVFKVLVLLARCIVDLTRA